MMLAQSIIAIGLIIESVSIYNIEIKKLNIWRPVEEINIIYSSPYAIFNYSKENLNIHEWYPRECCMDIDCAPVDTKEINQTEFGWNILISKETIAFDDSRVKASPDQQFHRCVKDFWDLASPTRCLFVPKFGMSSLKIEGITDENL